MCLRLSAIKPSDSAEQEFCYVRHADVPRYTAEGWQATPALSLSASSVCTPTITSSGPATLAKVQTCMLMSDMARMIDSE